MKKKILIIDDDRILAEMLVEQLTSGDHDAASAHTLADGLALLQQSSFDIVLLDVQLPDGKAKTKVIKTGLSDAMNIEVVKGLKKGEKVIEKPPKEIH